MSEKYIVIEDRLDKRRNVIWDAKIIDADKFIPGLRLNAVDARFLAYKLLKLADALQASRPPADSSADQGYAAPTRAQEGTTP